MRPPWIVAALLAGLAGASAAQQPREERDTAGAELLRREIERRFEEHVRTNVGLDDDQMNKLRATHQKYGPRRRQLMREWLGYELALRSQMRPGVAANPDSVRVYMDGQQRVRAEQLALDQDVDRDLRGFLTPVQHAQYRRLWVNFLQRVNEMRQGRPMRPRARPTAPRPRPPQRRP